MIIKTKAIVLKVRNLGENDRMLVILSKEFGRMEVVAKRVKSMKSKLAAATAPLCYAEFCIFRGKRYDTVNTADLIESFYALRLDVTSLSLASYFCDLTNFLSPHEERSWDCLRLLLNTLHHLAESVGADAIPPIAQIKAIFELRLLALSGFMPNLVACARCSSYTAEIMQFDPLQGVLTRCTNCSNGGGEGAACESIPLREGTLHAMRHILYATEQKLFAFSLKPQSLLVLAQVSERYVALHLQHSFASLSLYRQFVPEQNHPSSDEKQSPQNRSDETYES